MKPPEETNDFDRIPKRVFSRRELLKSVIALGSITALGSLGTAATAAVNRFAFSSISANNLDQLTVPKRFPG